MGKWAEGGDGWQAVRNLFLLILPLLYYTGSVKWSYFITNYPSIWVDFIACIGWVIFITCRSNLLPFILVAWFLNIFHYLFSFTIELSLYFFNIFGWR